MTYDFLIVGAGVSGCVLAERIATQLNKTCLIIDSRDHIAGNAYDYYDDNNILVHKYGPHIFHTNMKKVWDYFSQYTDWHIYFHKVLAVIDGKKVPVPFNFNSIYQLFSPEYAAKLENILLENFSYGMKIPILKLKENPNKDLHFLAEYIYNNVFLGYTLKQWGMSPEELDFSVTSRIPVFLSRDDRYFQDKYQAMPKYGYTKMYEKIINHKNIHLQLNTSFEEAKNTIKYKKIIYTGPIDQFFDYKFGKLPYRSLQFKYEKLTNETFQEVGQMNYPNNFDFTRITEFKHITGQKTNNSTIALEFSEAFELGKNEPYYPIPNDENHLLFEKYKQEADKIADDVIFTGRLADYKYYNMDQTVGVAFQVFEKKIALM